MRRSELADRMIQAFPWFLNIWLNCLSLLKLIYLNVSMWLVRPHGLSHRFPSYKVRGVGSHRRWHLAFGTPCWGFSQPVQSILEPYPCIHRYLTVFLTALRFCLIVIGIVISYPIGDFTVPAHHVCGFSPILCDSSLRDKPKPYS